MAVAPITVLALREGTVPSICVKSGVATDRWVQTTFRLVPGWTWWLILFGVLPFLVARFLAGESLEARLPFDAEVDDRLRRLRLLAGGAGVVGIALLLLGVADAPALVWGGSLVIVGAAVALAAASAGWVGVAAGKTRDEVLLTRLHPTFAYELGRMSREHSASP